MRGGLCPTWQSQQTKASVTRICEFLRNSLLCNISKHILFFSRIKRHKNANGNKKALGVGLKQPNGLAWANPNTPGYYANFTDIKCIAYRDSFECWSVWDSSVTFQGDTDGSDNWNQICAYFDDPSQEESKVEGQDISNYPAFEYAQNYATDAAGDSKLSGTSYETGWFIPSLAELVEIHQSNTIVNNVLAALGTENAQLIKDDWYWSSSSHSFNPCQSELARIFLSFIW